MAAIPKEVAGRIGLPQEQPMTTLDWMVIGKKECRLNVPLISRYDLRVVADQLRSLATVCDFESRRVDVPERTSLMRVRTEVDAANLIIRTHYESVYERLGIPQPKRGGRLAGTDEK